MQRKIDALKAGQRQFLASVRFYKFDAVDDDGSAQDVREYEDMKLFERAFGLLGDRQNDRPVLLPLHLVQRVRQLMADSQNFGLLESTEQNMRRIVQTVRKRFSQAIVTIANTVGGLQRTVQQAVAGRAVPEGVQARAQRNVDLERPVNDR